MNLARAFDASVKKRPEKTALFWGERTYSYAEIGDQTNWVSEHLRTELGVKPGDRVGLWLKNCPEFIGSLFGIFHAGAVGNFVCNTKINKTVRFWSDV